MAITIERDPAARACVVRLTGEMDLVSVPDVRSSLESIIESGCVHVVIDLSEVSYVDSSALGLIVWLDSQLSPCDGRLVLAGANEDVTRILELSGLVGVAPTISARDTVDEALAGLEPPHEATAVQWSESILLPAQAEALARARGAVCDLLKTVDLSDSALVDV